MHQTDFDLSIAEIAKIEGQAALELQVRSGKIARLKFKIADYKRFYTKAVENKHILGVPQQVARICGTCSNAHLLCSIKAIEQALNLKVSTQTIALRRLLNYGLIIRDHALHLYIFVLPDILGRDSILDFDEQDKTEHQLLHDAFAVKEAGNLLSIWAGGRSVHAPYAGLGGFSRLPTTSPRQICRRLRAIRPRILRLIDVFKNNDKLQTKQVVFAALADSGCTFLDGTIVTSDNKRIPSASFYQRLKHIALPYSQASAYKLRPNKTVMVGALARLNLCKATLHQRTQADAQAALKLFPSENIFHNNLAQAIEILHSIDRALDTLANLALREEKPLPIKNGRQRVGVGVIEAPRGLLFHEYNINTDGKVTAAKIIVPTGLNQILIEESLKTYLADKLTLPRKQIALAAEKLIRAFDPCISCATHFLKVKWQSPKR